MSMLPDADAFRRLADGSRRGPGAGLARACLALLEVPYTSVVCARNAAFDHGLLGVQTAPVPVVSVGNLTLGGTGKTPLVAWVASSCLAHGRRPAIVSRGYAAARGETSDEAAELARILPGVPHLADRDRAAAARRAAAHGADVVVLDDGFQHRRLARDLDIVAIDATDPFGCGRVFPRGLLREPLSGLRRARAIVLTRADEVDAERRDAILAALAVAHGARTPPVWAQARHAPQRLRTAAGREVPLDTIRGRRVVGLSGIGNPAAFRRTLSDAGAEVVEFRAFPDHHAYSTADAAAVGAAAAAAGADFVVTTLKDLVKLPHETLGGVPLVAIEVAVEFLVGGAELEDLVHASIGAGAASDRERGAA